MLLVLLPLLFVISFSDAQYTPDWESLDSRPLPTWYDDAKVGIFMHFGPYAVPGVESEWFWLQWNRNESAGDRKVGQFMEDYYPPKFTYQDFGPQLLMEFFDPYEFARIVAESGAKYMVFTSKHHDGFCNWPSSYSYGWNSMDVGPRRNVLQELKDAFTSSHPEIRLGLYYSLLEWYNPIMLKDKANGRTTREYPLSKMLPEMKELVETFAPEIFWSDGDWEGDQEYWGSKEFIAWLFNESPNKDTVVTNDRWGSGTAMTHGSFFSGPDRWLPGELQSHKWENAMTIDFNTWGVRRDIRLADLKTTKEIIDTLVSTISCGGNILVNVGPSREGTILPIFEERLREMGQWLGVNGEAIYSSRPWTFQNDTSNSRVWYTTKEDVVYALVLDWPTTEDNTVLLSSPLATEGVTVITMLGVSGELDYSVDPETGLLTVVYPEMSRAFAECGSTCVLLAQVLRMEGVTENNVVGENSGAAALLSSPMAGMMLVMLIYLFQW